jgi:hypothetical protein
MREAAMKVKDSEGGSAELAALALAEEIVQPREGAFDHPASPQWEEAMLTGATAHNLHAWRAFADTFAPFIRGVVAASRWRSTPNLRGIWVGRSAVLEKYATQPSRAFRPCGSDFNHSHCAPGCQYRVANSALTPKSILSKPRSQCTHSLSNKAMQDHLFTFHSEASIAPGFPANLPPSISMPHAQ